MLNDKKKIKARFNKADQRVLDEEQGILTQMNGLKRKYKTVKDIPREEIQRSGFSRIFNSRGYVLFKHLRNGDGAVVVR